jgi:hypothetical protein
LDDIELIDVSAGAAKTATDEVDSKRAAESQTTTRAAKI